MMKVLYCILDNRFGGPHRISYEVSLKLRTYDIETLFLTGRKSDDAWCPEGATVFQCRHIQCFQRHRAMLNFALFLLWLPWNVLKIHRIMRSRGIDVVHIDGVTNFVPALAAALARRPVVWTYNDHLPGFLKKPMLLLVRCLAQSVTVEGHKLKEIRTGHDSKLNAKTQVIYSCVDVREFDPDKYSQQDRDRIKQQLGLSRDCRIVGAIGNLNYLKGHTYFIEAAGIIKRRVKDVQFLIVGRRLGTAQDYWEQLKALTAQEGLDNDIVFAGFQEDIPAILSILDVFVLSSILESCPVSLLEAMAMRAPVVTTDVGATTEQVLDGQTGRIVPPRDGKAIAEAVLAYLTGPASQTEAMVEAARKRVEAEFDIDLRASQQKEIYEELVGSEAV